MDASAEKMGILPVEKRRLRACLLCALVKTQAQFRRDGCDNCEEVLQLRSSADRVADCTSPSFDGMIALMNPSRSWVARWQRCDKFAQGMYAIKVSGRLPVDIEEELEERGIRYRPRDGSAQD
jgi:transcription elongation factor SPT4